MSLVEMKSCLSEAQDRGYAVGAFNVTSMGSLMAIADAAVEAQAPVFFAVCDEDVRRCVALGISKINVYTQLNLWAAEVTRDRFTREPGFTDIPQLLLDVQARMKTGVMECMALFGCAGQATNSRTNP